MRTPATAARATALCALVLAIGAGRSADATTVIPLDDEALAAGSTLVVRGTVAEVRTAEYPVGPGIFTEFVIDVRERLDVPSGNDRGAADGGDAVANDPETGADTDAATAEIESVVVRIPGGTTDDRRVLVPGMPGFVQGEEVVVFLEALPARAFGEASPAFIPFGLQQGVWREAAGLWSRGDQEGLLPVAAPLVTRARTLDELRALCREAEARRAPQAPTPQPLVEPGVVPVAQEPVDGR